MIKINLLSPLDKENLKWEKVNSLVVKSIVWIVLTELLFVAGFLFTIEHLKVQQKAVAAELSSLEGRADTREVASIEEAVRVEQADIDGINKIETGHLGWAFLMDNIAQLLPDGAKLENVNIEQETTGKGAATATTPKGAATTPTPTPNDRFKITMAGNAQTREKLLLLEDNLKKSTLFTDLVCDDSNYVKSEDIDFSYVFYVTRGKLLR